MEDGTEANSNRSYVPCVCIFVCVCVYIHMYVYINSRTDLLRHLREGKGGE